MFPARGIPEGFDTPFLLRRGSETHAESPIDTPTSLSVYGEVTWRFWETGVLHDDHYSDGYRQEVDGVWRFLAVKTAARPKRRTRAP